MTIIVRNIVWDTDGEKITLPSKVMLPKEIADEYEYHKEDDTIITDYLSDEYGWCITSYDIEIIL